MGIDALREAHGAMQQPRETVNQDAIIDYVTHTFTGVEVVRPTDGLGADDTFFFYDPQRNIDPTRRFPFATIVTKDYGGFDEASNLNRADVFRLNVGLSRDTFHTLFGYPPTGDSVGNTDYDFADLDQLMPHPAYAQQSWVCVLNPGFETFEMVKPLLAEAHSRAAAQHVVRQTHRD